LIHDGPAASQQIPLHLALNLAHQRGIRFDPEVVVGQIVYEQLAILEYGIDRLPEIAGIRTDTAHHEAICLLVGSDDNVSLPNAGRIEHVNTVA